MPAKRFWCMELQIGRIQAAELQAQIPLMQCGMGGEHVSKYNQTLQERIGTVADVRPVEFVRTAKDQKERLAALSKSANTAR